MCNLITGNGHQIFMVNGQSQPEQVCKYGSAPVAHPFRRNVSRIPDKVVKYSGQRSCHFAFWFIGQSLQVIARMVARS